MGSLQTSTDRPCSTTHFCLGFFLPTGNESSSKPQGRVPGAKGPGSGRSVLTARPPTALLGPVASPAGRPGPERTPSLLNPAGERLGGDQGRARRELEASDVEKSVFLGPAESPTRTAVPARPARPETPREKGKLSGAHSRHTLPFGGEPSPRHAQNGVPCKLSSFAHERRGLQPRRVPLLPPT